MKRSIAKRRDTARRKRRRAPRTGRKKMDAKDLRFFIAVYEAKGFSHACRELGTVQSNVSSRIRNLERFLGVPLFERRYRGIVPTEKGEKLYEHAKLVLASLYKTAQVIRPSEAA